MASRACLVEESTPSHLPYEKDCSQIYCNNARRCRRRRRMDLRVTIRLAPSLFTMCPRCLFWQGRGQCSVPAHWRPDQLLAASKDAFSLSFLPPFLLFSCSPSLSTPAWMLIYYSPNPPTENSTSAVTPSPFDTQDIDATTPGPHGTLGDYRLTKMAVIRHRCADRDKLASLSSKKASHALSIRAGEVSHFEKCKLTK